MSKQLALDLAAALCRRFEGFSAVPYLCPAGVWTQGYGTVWKPDGTRVQPTDAPITREQANDWLVHELEFNYMAGVLKASPVLAQHPQRLAAVVSFAYNLGVAAYRGSTLRRRVDAGDWAGAAEQLLRWVRAGGKVLKGLVLRRKAEAEYMLAYDERETKYKDPQR